MSSGPFSGLNSNANASSASSRQDVSQDDLQRGFGELTTASNEDEVNSFKASDSDHTASNSSGDVLPRDMEPKTHTYDYAYEKSMSHAEAKLFYRHHQLASQGVGNESPQISSLDDRSTPNTQTGEMPDNSSVSQWPIGSKNKATTNTPEVPGSVPAHAVQHSSFQGERNIPSSHVWNEGFIPANQSARNHAIPPKPFYHQTPYLSSADGMHTDGTGLPGSRATMVFPPSKNAVTSELNAIYRNIRGLLARRAEYIKLSSQGPHDNPKDLPGWKLFPPPPEPAWDHGKEPGKIGDSSCSGPMKRKMGEDIGEDFDMAEFFPLPEESNWTFKLDASSVYQVYESENALLSHQPIIKIPSLRDFYIDLDTVLDVSTDGPTKSFAFKRISYLEGKFQLHSLLNEYQEIADSKKVPHRDFYNVRKVDTHVHHSACMNQKHLLRFIKSKMKKSPDEVVLFRDGKHLTLKEVFESVNLTAYDLSIDTLDMHVRINHLFRNLIPMLIGHRRTLIHFIGLTNSISNIIQLESLDCARFSSRRTTTLKGATWRKSPKRLSRTWSPASTKWLNGASRFTDDQLKSGTSLLLGW